VTRCLAPIIIAAIIIYEDRQLQSTRRSYLLIKSTDVGIQRSGGATKIDHFVHLPYTRQALIEVVLVLLIKIQCIEMQ